MTDDSLPDWDDNEGMTAWIIRRLRNQDNGTEEEDFRGAGNFAAVMLRKVFPVPGETPFDRAVSHASWWDFGPLKALCPRIAPYINPPRGKRPPKNPWEELRSKRDVTAAGHYAAIACEAARLHFHGSSSSIFVLG